MHDRSLVGGTVGVCDDCDESTRPALGDPVAYLDVVVLLDLLTGVSCSSSVDESIYNSIDVLGGWMSCSTRIWQQTLHMEFEEIVSIMNEYRYENVRSSGVKYENKIVLMLISLIQYPRYSVLSVMFGVSEFIVSKIVEEMLPYFVPRHIDIWL